MHSCPRCQTVMQEGIGINPTTPDPYITHENIKLDKVWKFSSCGHSKDMTPLHG